MKQTENDLKCVYRLDSEYKIIFVNEFWTLFASDNHADNLCDQEVLGNSIWDYITDRETVELYKAILVKVAQENTVIRFPFRCDAPTARRFMEMQVSRLPNGSYEFASVILRTESRGFQPLLSAFGKKGDDFIRSCGWCKKIAVPPERWVEVEEAVQVLKLFNQSVLPQITHGICPHCQGKLLAKLGTIKCQPNT